MNKKELVSVSLFCEKKHLDNYYKGMPCMLGEIVGKIVGESEDGSWGEINGVKMFSVPLFATPHGTIIKTGVMKLTKITDDGLLKLEEYEKDVIESGDEIYGGFFTYSKVYDEGKPCGLRQEDSGIFQKGAIVK